MDKEILFVGIDVDDKSYTVVGSRPYQHGKAGSQNEVFEFKCKPTVQSLVRKLKTYQGPRVELKLCYEATYVGFSLRRALVAKGYDCEVVAASLMRQSKGKKIKTDRLDAKVLSKDYANGELTIVHVPTPSEENDRDLIRSRAFLRAQLKGIKAHITSLCRRQGWDYKSGKAANYWTLVHRDWLQQKIKSAPERVAQNMGHLLFTVQSLEATIATYDVEIEHLSKTPKYEKKVKALRCYRGIDTQSAMVFITEFGDINRFSHPTQTTSYSGMDIKEYSSGDKIRKYRITKDGNAHIRTAAVECAQTARLVPNISKKLKARRKEADSEEQISIADRCMKRLYRKSQKMYERGKGTNITKVACARELLCFVWESLHAA